MTIQISLSKKTHNFIQECNFQMQFDKYTKHMISDGIYT